MSMQNSADENIRQPKPDDYSYKKLKCPRIRIGNELATKLNEEYYPVFRNPERSLPPPLFPQFCIDIEFSPDREYSFTEVQTILVDYITPEWMYILVFLNGKKDLAIWIDVGTLQTKPQHLTAETYMISNARMEEFKEASENVHQFATSCLLAVFSVSDYMLNYSPELEYLPRKEASPSERKRYPNRRRELILKSKKMSYHITEITRKRPAEYKVPAWYRRGHYRKMKNGKAVFVSATIAHRKAMGKAEPEGQRYRIKE